jgi:hypothetical protein
MPSLISRGSMSARAFGFGAVLGSLPALVVSRFSTPYIRGYYWDDTTGFGTVTNIPSTGLAGAAYSLNFNSLNTNLIVGHATTPFLSAYAWSNGFGTKYTNPSTLPTGVKVGGTFLNNAETAIINMSSVSPYINIYAWNNTTGFGTKYANPTFTPKFINRGCINNTDTVIAVSAYEIPFVEAYSWNNTTGFGTKYADPSSYPTNVSGESGSITFNPTGTDLVFTYSLSPRINGYPWSGGFGTKYADPSWINSYGTLSNSNFTRDGLGLIFSGYSTTSNMYASQWSSGFTNTFYTNSSVTIPTTATTYAICLKYNQKVIASTGTVFPYIYVNKWSTVSGFGTRFSNPSSALTDQCRAAAFTS